MKTRTVIALAALLAGGCSGLAPEDSPSVQSPPAVLDDPSPKADVEEASPDDPTTAPSPSPAPIVGPPLAAPYETVADEVYPNAKRLAAGVVLELLNFDGDATPLQLAARVEDDPESRALLAGLAEDLVTPDRWSRGTIVYPQLSGVTPDNAGVMVVAEQRTGGAEGDPEQVVTRTFDVRLRLVDGAWALDEVSGVGGPPVPRPDDLTELEAAVLDDPRIDLPDSTRWDIHAGGVSPDLLELMRRLAERTPYGVITITNGHPPNVWDTDRLSNHTVGRAVDVHLLGDRLVVHDRAEGSPTYETVEWLYDQERLSEVGSPWALDERGGLSFSDVVHADHIHIGVLPEDLPRRLRPSERPSATPSPGTGTGSATAGDEQDAGSS